MLKYLTSHININRERLTRLLVAGFAEKKVKGDNTDKDLAKNKEDKAKTPPKEEVKVQEPKKASEPEEKKKPKAPKKPMTRKERLQKFLKKQESIKAIFDYSHPARPGMDIFDYIKKRDKVEYVFTPPVRYSQSGDTMGIRIRTGYEKLRYEFPTVYPRKRFPTPDQFRYEMPPNYIEDHLRKDSYFKDFVPPYKIENEAFNRCIVQIKENKDSCDEMISLLPKLSYEDLSTIPLIFSFETPYNNKKFWNEYQKLLLEKYPTFPKDLLWRIRYGLRRIDAELTPLKHTIHSRGVECIKCASCVSEIPHILKCFQGSIKPRIYLTALSALVNRRDEFLSFDPTMKDPQFIANLIYTLGVCRPIHWGTLREIVPENTKEFLVHYEDIILDSINKLGAADAARLLLGLSGLKNNDYPNILYRLEKRLVELKDKLDHNELADVIWGFAHVCNGALGGRDSTFKLLEPLFMEKAKLMNHWQVSRCAYTFSARKHDSEALYKYLDKRLQDELPNMNYGSLHNVAYYLLMRDSKDDEFWKAFIYRTLAIPEVMPLVYYYPFKLCWQYLDAARPDWEVSALREKLWWAERFKVAIMLEEDIGRYKEYANFIKVFSSLKLEPAIFYTFENSFQIHLAFLEMKVGIMIHLDKDMVPETMRVNQSKLIPGRILRNLGWEILDISYREFIEMGRPKALKYLKDWLEIASDIQAENRVVHKVPFTNYV